MKKLLSSAILTGFVLSSAANLCFAVGENMINTSAGSIYAGYGYTHGRVPVAEDSHTTWFYDSEIWRYDVNKSKPAQYYYVQENQTSAPEQYRQPQQNQQQQQN